MRVAVFLASLSLALGFSPSRLISSRSLIVGGVEAPVGSRPYQVSILKSNNGEDQHCGGTLVHPKWVVSAAHCVGPTNDVWVGVGFHDLRDTAVDGATVIKGKWIQHANFDPSTADIDIALIELDQAAVLSDRVQTIPIARANSDVASGTSLLVSGWGKVKSDGATSMVLRQVVVNGVSRNSCNNKYTTIVEITDSMFCAAAPGKDSCSQDSGGPIVTGFDENVHVNGVTLAGIVSWGLGCADPAYPGVYTRVSLFCGWIDKKTSSAVKCS